MSNEAKPLMSLFLWFDNRTLLCCLLLLSFALSIALFGIGRGLQDRQGVGSIASGFLLSIPAISLLLAQGTLPNIISVVAANLLLVLCLILFCRGVLHLIGSTRTMLPIWAASLVTMAVIFYYSQVHDDIVPRLIAISFNITLLRIFLAVELFRHAAGRAVMRSFALFMTFMAILSLSWGLFALLHGVPNDYMQQSHAQTFTLVLTIFSICLSGLFSLSISHDQLLNLVRTESQLDPLSGTLNRRGIEQKLAIELKRIERSGQQCSVALIDIDNFKAINDTAGHAAGDNAIRRVVTATSAQLRAYDLLGRYGGDEFLLILPQTPCSCALIVAERIGHAVRTFSSSAKDHSLTISVGLTEAVPGEQAITLIARADQALYQAKNAGRNCVRTVLHQTEDTITPQPVVDILLPPNLTSSRT
jgi:diguanylate cyclase (GGDEF)-like protein